MYQAREEHSVEAHFTLTIELRSKSSLHTSNFYVTRGFYLIPISPDKSPAVCEEMGVPLTPSPHHLKWGFPKIRGTFLGSPYLGKHQIFLLKAHAKGSQISRPQTWALESVKLNPRPYFGTPQTQNCHPYKMRGGQPGQLLETPHIWEFLIIVLLECLQLFTINHA